MAAKTIDKSGELLQIIILTLFITSGFLAVACLVFLFLIPGQEQKAKSAQEDLKDLVVSLRSKSTETQRDRYLQFKKEADSQKSLRDILLTQKAPLDFNSFSSQTPKREKGTVTYTQPVGIREAPLQDLVNFVARVRTAQESVKTSRIVLNRKSRGRRSGSLVAEPGTTPLWNADLTFTMSRNEEIIRKYLPRSKELEDEEADSSAPAGN